MMSSGSPKAPIKFSKLLDWIYPPTCVACNSIIPLNEAQPRDMFLCRPCQFLFETIELPFCKCCGVPTENEVPRCVSCHGKNFHFTANRATFVYDELIRDLLLDLKFNKKKQIAHTLGKLWATHVDKIHIPPMYEYFYEKSTAPQVAKHDTFLIPLPMHKKKQRERGFNQAEIMAQHLSTRLNIPVENTIVRIQDTPPQSGLHPRQRIENIAGAFGIAKGGSPADKNYIIVDDIYTTGASINECAKVLKEANAADVSCMTLSIAHKKDKQSTKGFTLIELIIALGVWMILSLSVFFIWQYTSSTVVNTITRQNAFENARASMDVLVMNIQLASAISLETDDNNILQRLTLTERNPQGQLHNYVFEFDINAPATALRRYRLIFGQNEFADHIGRIYITYIPGRRMDITVQTNCDEPVVLSSSVDVRYKDVVVNAP